MTINFQYRDKANTPKSKIRMTKCLAILSVPLLFSVRGWNRAGLSSPDIQSETSRISGGHAEKVADGSRYFIVFQQLNAIINIYCTVWSVVQEKRLI